MSRMLIICAAASLIAGAAYAQTGSTSGSAAGSDVKPSSSATTDATTRDKSGTVAGSSSTSEKTPGVQGAAGAENGPAPENKMK